MYILTGWILANPLNTRLQYLLPRIASRDFNHTTRRYAAPNTHTHTQARSRHGACKFISLCLHIFRWCGRTRRELVHASLRTIEFVLWSIQQILTFLWTNKINRKRKQSVMCHVPLAAQNHHHSSRVTIPRDFATGRPRNDVIILVAAFNWLRVCMCSNTLAGWTRAYFLLSARARVFGPLAAIICVDRASADFVHACAFYSEVCARAVVFFSVLRADGFVWWPFICARQYSCAAMFQISAHERTAARLHSILMRSLPRSGWAHSAPGV